MPRSKTLLLVLLAVLLATLFPSCSGNSAATPPPPSGMKGSEATSSPPLTAHDVADTRHQLMDHWYLVKRSPPTFYPNGIPKDAPTNYRDGEWIVAREGGGRWFIPFKGIKDVPRAQLMEEAFAWRTELQKIQKERRRQEHPEEVAGEALAKTGLSLAMVAAYTAGAMGGVGISDDSPFMLWFDDMWEAAGR